MGKKPSARNRVMNDRLWDDHGQEWHKQFGWLSHKDIEQLLKTRRVAVHEYGLPLLWMSTSDAQTWWRRARAHTQDGERAAGSADGHGCTYTAARWTAGGAEIVVFQAFC